MIDDFGLTIDDCDAAAENRLTSIVNRKSKDWWHGELEARRVKSLRRALRILPPRSLDLASNDYLGLSRHPGVLQAAHDALENYGAGARSSRLVSGQLEIHAALETKIAAFKSCESALVFPSGYHANLAVVTAFARSGDAIFCDKRNHASLIDACFLAHARGAKLRFYDSLSKLRALLENDSSPARLIVSDAVFSMDGDIAPLPKLLELSVEFDALFILDDAHGTGVLGATGKGTLEHFNISKLETSNAKLVQIGTLSKAIGAQGGFVAARNDMIEWLINAARAFIYTTGLNPAACGAALAALGIIEREPERLRRLHDVKTQLARGLQTLGFDAREQLSPIIPILIGDAQNAVELFEKLLSKNIWCPAIRPPTVPQNTSRLRLTARADLSYGDISGVLQAFAECR